MKIYELQLTEIGEKAWVAANSITEAIETYVSSTGEDIINCDDKYEIVELPKEKWSEMTVTNTEYVESDPNDWEEMTLEQWMAENTSPDLIAISIQD